MKSNARAAAEKSCKEAHQGSGAFRRGICHACVIRTGKPDRRGSFSFNHATGWYQCFKCAVHGRLDGFEDLEEPEEEDRPEMKAPFGFYELCRGDGRGAAALDPARKYLRGRGLTDEQLWREAHVGACIEGFYDGRVVVPVLSPDGDWLGFVARAWMKKHPIPYLYPRGMARREVLYNHAALLVRTEKPVFVVEGVLDALALWPDAVAVLGKPSDGQLIALAETPRPVAVALDGDAWAEGEELAMRLELEGQRACNIKLPPKTDPDEVPRAWLDEEARRLLA
jgi:hypothetical protein